MRDFRLVLAVVVFATVAGTFVSSAGAVGFADQPCTEPGQGSIRVCPTGIVGQKYVVKLAGHGGCGPALPYQYRLLSGELPPGLFLSRDGVLSGVPTAAGNWDFWLELSDQNPPSAPWCVPHQSQREFLIRVGAPAGTVGTPYSLGVGTEGEVWSVAAGALPPGLRLDPSLGVIAGTLSPAPIQSRCRPRALATGLLSSASLSPSISLSFSQGSTSSQCESDSASV